MGRKKANGYFFVTYIGDHPPYHVHIEDKDGNEIGRWDIENQRPMQGEVFGRRILDGLTSLGYRLKPSDK